jgi:hypothetical protein
MVGIRNIMPISRKSWLSGGEEASQIVMYGGTT